MFSTTDLLVGVDIHRRTNVVQVMDGTGQLLSSQLRVANNRSGTAVLVNHLAQTAADGGFDRHSKRPFMLGLKAIFLHQSRHSILATGELSCL